MMRLLRFLLSFIRYDYLDASNAVQCSFEHSHLFLKHANQQTYEADYKALWYDLYNTLRWDYGLDNLIWMYSFVPCET